MEMTEIMEKRKFEQKHTPKCIFEDVETCNKKFDESCFSNDMEDTNSSLWYSWLDKVLHLST